MTVSNLSKIKTKLRTTGRVSGNFGRNRVKANSPLQTIGETKGAVGNLPTQDDYLARLYRALDLTTDVKLQQFINIQIRQILVQQGKW